MQSSLIYDLTQGGSNDVPLGTQRSSWHADFHIRAPIKLDFTIGRLDSKDSYDRFVSFKG